MIEIKNVSFAYDQEVILKDANLTIDANKITVILGKNGVGKTTLLSLIDGFLTVDEGKILKTKEGLYIYDEPHLYDYLTGREYITLIKSVAGVKKEDEIDGLIKALSLEESLDKMIHAYSLGMKHKLALLTALMVDYGIYLIDEPLAALDPESQRFMIDFFKSIKTADKSLLITTHMLEVAYELADDIVVFKDHQLEKISNDFETFQSFKTYVLEALKTHTISNEPISLHL